VPAATISPISVAHSRAQSVVRPELTEAKRLGDEITELCSYLYAAEARLLKLIREFDEKECWAEQGFCSCAHWLNFKCGIGMNAAREKVRVARALVDLPKTEARLARGELSYSKVRAMTRIATADNEEALLNVARHGTAHHVEKLVAKYRSAKRMQDAAVAEEQYRDRELSHYYDHDGCLVIKARMPAEQGALIVKALEMAMEKDFVADSDNKEQRVAARRADALANIAETYMNNDEYSGSTADRYQVVVHVTAETSDLGDAADVTAETFRIEDGPHVTAETSRIEDGPHVTAETSRRICCDSTVIKIKEDESGEPLSIGRRSRTIPPAIRRALRVRDGGCRFPGCTHTRFVDGHHIRHWADGGETRLDNLVLLCRHHHHLVHEGGFTCEKSNDGEVCFRDPSQQPLPTFSELPKVASEQDLKRWLDNEFIAATADNDGCDARWYAGERIDWQMAVSALFPSV
jgi:hypothetical protein